MAPDGSVPIDIVVHPSQAVVAPGAGAVVALEGFPPRHGVHGLQGWRREPRQPAQHVSNHLPLCKQKDGEDKGRGGDHQAAQHLDGMGTARAGAVCEGSYRIG